MVLGHHTFRRLCQARQLLAEVSDETIPIKDVAHQAGISPFHFIRRFAALFGATPHQFRIRSRVDRAKILLATGQRSVTEVCMEVGFSSLGSFSALFTRRVGMTPTGYRRRASMTRASAPGSLPQELFPGCLTLMGRLPEGTFRNSGEASAPSDR